MKTAFPGIVLAIVACGLCNARAEPEIRMDGKGAAAAYFFMRDGEVLGTFWSPFTGESDYGFAAAEGIEPEFSWSPDQRHVAVEGGKPDAPTVFVYEVTQTGLNPVELPSLPRTARRAVLRIVGWDGPGRLQLASGAEASPLLSEYDVSTSPAREVDAGSAVSKPPEPGIGGLVGPTVRELVGRHSVEGTNPDGSTYSGTVRLRDQGPLVLLEWDIRGAKSYGTGLLEGRTLGVALESGVALYDIRPASGGRWVLDGVWATEGADAVNTERIRVGDGPTAGARIEVPDLSGRFTSTIEGQDSLPLVIAGEGPLMTLRLGRQRAEGLALGKGFAMITPDGLAVYSISRDAAGFRTIAGRFVNARGQVSAAVLFPED